MKTFATILCLATVLAMFNQATNAQTYPIEVKEYGISDLTVKMKKYGIADETWKIKGACTYATTYTKVKVKQYGIADLTVKIKKYGLSDRVVCIKNPWSLPIWLKLLLE